MENTTKIVIVDDHNLILEGLASLIKSINGYKLAGQFNSVSALMSFLSDQPPPDLFILDIEMPEKTGLQAVGVLKEKCPQSKILMLTVHDEAYFINRAILAGANAYLLKNSTREILEKTINRIISGESFICEIPTSQISSSSNNDVPEKQLTSREVQILKLIAQGKSSKDIASALFISSRTADTHRNNLKRKLGLSTSGELVRYAFDHGYL